MNHLMFCRLGFEKIWPREIGIRQVALGVSAFFPGITLTIAVLYCSSVIANKMRNDWRGVCHSETFLNPSDVGGDQAIKWFGSEKNRITPIVEAVKNAQFGELRVKLLTPMKRKGLPGATP